MEQWTPRLLDRKQAGGGERGRGSIPAPRPSGPVSLPVDARALDAEQHAQVDAGPAGVRLAAVAALPVASHALHALQGALALGPTLPKVRGRVDAACGWGRCAVQPLGTVRGPLSPRGAPALVSPAGTPSSQPEMPAQARAPEAKPAHACVHTHSHTHSAHTCTRTLARSLRGPCAHAWGVLGGPHLAVAAVWALPVGGGDAGLHGVDPGLPQLL